MGRDEFMESTKKYLEGLFAVIRCRGKMIFIVPACIFSFFVDKFFFQSRFIFYIVVVAVLTVIILRVV
jgi:hypothetical protein